MAVSTSKIDSETNIATVARFELFIALLIFLLVPLFGFWQIFGGQRSFFINYDNVQQFYPWYQKLAQSVHHWYIPIWDANVLSGHSFAGEFQPGIFYPLNILFVAAFGDSSGISVRVLEWLVLLHYFIAIVGMFLVSRAINISVLSSTVVATIFAYAGTFSFRAGAQTCIFFGDALLPTALLFSILCVKRKNLAFAGYAGVIVGLEILAGHLQPPSIATLLVVGIFAGEAIRTRKVAFAIKATSATLAIAIIVAMPQLFFGLQYLSHSYRWVGADSPILGTTALPFSTYLADAYTPRQFLNVVDPWNHPIVDANVLFIGCAPIVTLVLALSDPKSRSAALRLLAPISALAVLALFSLLMLSGPMTPVAQVVFSLPFSAAAVRELGRYAILFQVFAVIAVGIAIDSLTADGYEGWNRLRPTAVIALVASLAYAIFLRSHSINGVALSNIIILTLLAVLLFRGTRRRSVVAILIAIEAALTLPAVANDSSGPTYPATLFAPDELLRPPELCYPNCRVAAVGDAYPANIGDVFPLQTILGHGATMYQPYYDLLGAGGFDVHGFVQDALNVRYIVSDQKLEGFKLIQSDASTGRYLYERETAFPRVYSYAALAAKSTSLNDVSFKVVTYSDMKCEYDVSVPKGETVVFAEQFYPGWAVFVDGARAEMLEASISGSAPILRAVNVSAGDHRIRFEYPR